MRTQLAINKAISSDLDAQLAPGEKVLWRGRPERGPFVRRTWPLSIFGTLLLMSILAFETVVLGQGGDYARAVGNALASIILGVGAAALGFALGNLLRS